MLPRGDGGGGAHRLAEQTRTRGVCRGDPRRRPFLDRRPVDLERFEQLLEAVLRMARREHVPARLVHVPVEAGQDHGAARQGRDHLEQSARRGDAAGRARGDHPALGRRGAPQRGDFGQQAMPALRRVQRALCGEQVGPELRNHRQDLAILLPVLGEVLRDQVGESLERHALGLQLVEQRRQFLGQAQGMADRPSGALEETREQQLAAQGADRRRHGEVEGTFDQQLVGVDLAERLDARQQQRPPRRLVQKRLGEQAAGAPGRQQDQEIGQLLRRRIDLGAQAGGERLDERHAGGDGRHTRHASIYHEASSSRDRELQVGQPRRSLGSRSSRGPEHVQTFNPARAGSQLRNPGIGRVALAQLEIEPVGGEDGLGALGPFDQPRLAGARRIEAQFQQLRRTSDAI
jgi:hypothetical protein